MEPDQLVGLVVGAKIGSGKNFGSDNLVVTVANGISIPLPVQHDVVRAGDDAGEHVDLMPLGDVGDDIALGGDDGLWRQAVDDGLDTGGALWWGPLGGPGVGQHTVLGEGPQAAHQHRTYGHHAPAPPQVADALDGGGEQDRQQWGDVPLLQGVQGRLLAQLQVEEHRQRQGEQGPSQQGSETGRQQLPSKGQQDVPLGQMSQGDARSGRQGAQGLDGGSAQVAITGADRAVSVLFAEGGNDDLQGQRQPGQAEQADGDPPAPRPAVEQEIDAEGQGEDGDVLFT